jgi:hypothetical protein
MPSKCSSFAYRHVRRMSAIAPLGLLVEDVHGATLRRGKTVHNLRKWPLNTDDRDGGGDGYGKGRRPGWSPRVGFSSTTTVTPRRAPRALPVYLKGRRAVCGRHVFSSRPSNPSCLVAHSPSIARIHSFPMMPHGAPWCPMMPHDGELLPRSQRKAAIPSLRERAVVMCSVHTPYTLLCPGQFCFRYQVDRDGPESRLGSNTPGFSTASPFSWTKEAAFSNNPVTLQLRFRPFRPRTATLGRRLRL